MEKGQREILTTSSDLAGFKQIVSDEDRAYVDEAEVVELASRWGTYKGQEVGSEAIRAWLTQFGNMRNQRLMFTLLCGVKFYGGSVIRARLRDAHDMVARSLVGAANDRYGPGKQRRSDLLLTDIDDAGKSGAQYARWYADENAVYVDNVVSRERLPDVLDARPDVKAVVCVDDFVGTGRTASDHLEAMAERLSAGAREVPWFYIAVCGFDSGRVAIERAVGKLDIEVEVRLVDPLSESARCFDGDEVFRDPEERSAAKSLAYEKGVILVPRDPLGFGGGQALVVFDGSIPNNCPPILWQARPDWRPLFRRL